MASRKEAAEPTVTDDTTSPESASKGLGFVGWLRWFWRQLTSMRTALFLLLMVAVAAIPGSVFPQKSIDMARVNQYQTDHPELSPWLERFGFFNVYSTPWFAALYLLLAISLIGCILPRSKAHWQAMRAGVPKMPRNVTRLPAHDTRTVEASVAEVVSAANAELRKRRYKLRQDVGEGEVASEGGMMRETGNLLFHLSIVGIIVAVAAGHLWSWRGDVIVPDKSGFSSTMTRYDTLQLGPWVDLEEDLPDWSLKMNKLTATFEKDVDPTSPQWGQPRDFNADVTYKESPTAQWKKEKISVNHPLKVGGGEVYLLGNGYAPKITYKDAKGNVLYDQATPFLSIDNKYKSTGAFKIPGATPKQIGLFGFFLPTAYFDQKKGPSSAFPEPTNPALVLSVYTGDLYPNGRPQSVFSLDTNSMQQVKDTNGQPLRIMLTKGQTVKLPNNMGSITFDEIPRWAGLSIRHDPGKGPALFFGLLALGGLLLSLTIRRRRVFLRAVPDGEGRTLVEIGGLAKGEDPRLGVAVEQIFDSIEKRLAGKAS